MPDNDRVEEVRSEKTMMRQLILEKLKKRNCRITAQRKLIIDIILENKCSCCKEIYYQAIKKDATIGIATVYRMLALLEEIGAINRKNMYQIQSETLGENNVMTSAQEEKIIFVNKNNRVELIQASWYNEIKEHLKNRHDSGRGHCDCSQGKRALLERKRIL